MYILLFTIQQYINETPRVAPQPYPTRRRNTATRFRRRILEGHPEYSRNGG